MYPSAPIYGSAAAWERIAAANANAERKFATPYGIHPTMQSRSMQQAAAAQRGVPGGMIAGLPRGSSDLGGTRGALEYGAPRRMSDLGGTRGVSDAGGSRGAADFGKPRGLTDIGVALGRGLTGGLTGGRPLDAAE